MALIGLVLMTFVADHGQAAEAPLWLAEGRPTQQAKDMVRALSMADQHGLRPADYELLSAAELLEVMAINVNPALSARFDGALTSVTTRFVTHIARGRVPASAAGFDLPKESTPLDVDKAVRELAAAADVSATIASYEPAPLPYRSLKRSLSRYRALASRLTAVELPPLPKNEAGNQRQCSGHRIVRRPILRRHLWS